MHGGELGLVSFKAGLFVIDPDLPSLRTAILHPDTQIGEEGGDPRLPEFFSRPHCSTRKFYLPASGTG